MKIRPARKSGKVVIELDRKEPQLPARESGPAVAALPVFKLKKILVPIDFSECSRKALTYAVPMAKQFDAVIVLLFVVQVHYPVPDWGVVDTPLIERQLRDTGEAELANLAAQEIRGQVQAATLVRVGNAYHEIVATARAEEADLIVMSTHGHTGLKHVLLGSTTERVVRYAPCPVLIVREFEHEFVADAGR
jgi:nucleotide-binding universal stress UspA family protein